jgi:hypothetical protein
MRSKKSKNSNRFVPDKYVPDIMSVKGAYGYQYVVNKDYRVVAVESTGVGYYYPYVVLGNGETVSAVNRYTPETFSKKMYDKKIILKLVKP